MNFYTADSHFSLNDDSVISRDYRPFKTLKEMNEGIINNWNKQAGKDDVIYHLGDFVNYNLKDLDCEPLLKLVQKINAKVVLILGNNEKRILTNRFGGNFEKFRDYLLGFGFSDVFENEMRMNIAGKEFKLVHCPNDADKTNEYNLFGHVHRCVFVKEYGFNMGVDNHNLELFSEDDVLDLYDRRKFYDENVYN